MRETIDFRISEDDARGNLPDDVGERLGGTVRRVVVTIGDPLFLEIRRLEQEFRSRGEVFFAGWIPNRKYSSRELAQAEILKVSTKKVFEPAGEECGTRYDDARACPVCGGGAPQITPLYLDGRRLPRGVDYSETIAGEIIVSRRVVHLFQEEGLSGAAFEPVRLVNKSGAPSSEYYQLRVNGARVQLDDTTRVGTDPFDDERGGACQQGDVIGLNLLSEVRVRRSTYQGCDITETIELIGVRRGLLRPRPVLLISAKTWRAIDAAKLKGFVIEIAHLI